MTRQNERDIPQPTAILSKYSFCSLVTRSICVGAESIAIPMVTHGIRFHMSDLIAGIRSNILGLLRFVGIHYESIKEAALDWFIDICYGD